MSEPKPGIPFGFPVHFGGQPMKDGERVEALGGFMFDRTQSQPAGLREVKHPEECPFCHGPLIGLSDHPNGGGRCVFDDGATVLVDPLPADVDPLSCVECNMTFYTRTDVPTFDGNEAP